MNEGVKDTNKKRLKEEDIEKVPAKVEVTEQGSKKRKGGHIKMIARKKLRKQSDDDSDDEHRKCLKIVTFEGTLDSEIMEKKSVIARLDKLMMEQYSEITLEGFELILWGDLKIMMESSTEENDQSVFLVITRSGRIILGDCSKLAGVLILVLSGIIPHIQSNIHSQCSLYCPSVSYTLISPLSRLQRSVQFGTLTTGRA
ncbi:hypothetical protein Tco_0404021 [Tanacetum coccineum]